MPTPLAERFWPKVNKDGPVIRPELGPCWVWTASVGTSGYGQIGVGGRAGRPVQAHRVSWELAHGAPAGDAWVLHRCDNPLCVRPDHLFLGTNADNAHDMAAKGRHFSRQAPEKIIRGERHGRAKLTAEDVREIRRAYAAGEGDQAQIASRHGVTQSTVGRIVLRKIWAHVA